MDNNKVIIDILNTVKTAIEEAIRLLSDNAAETAEKAPAPQVLQVDGNTAPWVEKAREFFGMDEKDNHAELEAFMHINPETTPWCGYFVDHVLGACGLATTNSGRAADFATYGTPCEKQNGAIAVFANHVGFVVNDTKILGGNQGDMVKENNLAWYEQNMELLGYRCPEGYELT